MSIKISELPEATTIGNNDIIPIVQSGTTKNIKYDKIKYNGITVWSGTENEYSAIETKSNTTLYLIREE